MTEVAKINLDFVKQSNNKQKKMERKLNSYCVVIKSNYRIHQ